MYRGDNIKKKENSHGDLIWSRRHMKGHMTIFPAFTGGYRPHVSPPNIISGTGRYWSRTTAVL